MTLNASGPISLGGTTAGQSIEVELGGSGTTQISLNDANVRTLAGVPSGAITMPTNFYGKSNRRALSYTFSASTANASLNVSSIGGYIAGKSDITITVNAGVYLYATTTGNYGLNLTGGSAGDTVTLVNNGYIMGQGGNAGPTNGTAAGNGGPALNIGIGVNITINQTNASAYIGGGGGGGRSSAVTGGGGGAGGGNGTVSAVGGVAGTGGSIGASGTNATAGAVNCCGFYYYYYGGGGGGRIFPGSGGGQHLGGGAGGGGGDSPSWVGSGGGAGGSSNGAGGNAQNYGSGGYGSGGGGGWGATGGYSVYGVGGSGGKAINLNGKTITWVSGVTARVWGTVS